jgi:malate synthase
MEDAATAEISRAQVWQWLKHGARLSDGRTVTRELVGALLVELKEEHEPAWKPEAVSLFERLSYSSDFPDFLTEVAYDYVD